MAIPANSRTPRPDDARNASDFQVNSNRTHFIFIIINFKYCRCRIELEENQRKGVIADSALYDLPQFDIVWDCPIEEFHNIKEGLSKQIMHRMFIKKKTVYSRAVKNELSQLYENMAVFSESPRKTRAISVGQFKGNEFGLLTLSAMPTLSYFIIRSKKDEWCAISKHFPFN